MYSQEPVWLSPQQILQQDKAFCYFNHINERFIGKLFDSFLLGGKFNRKSKSVEIIQESFGLLKRHVQFNFDVQSKNYSEITRPEYLNRKFSMPYEKELVWHSPKDLLDIYGEIVKVERNFSTDFIGDLAKSGLVIGKFHQVERCFHINSRSFAQLLKYRDYILQNYRLLE